MVSILTFNTGLIRITVADVTPIRWSRDLLEAARALPDIAGAATKGIPLAGRVAGLLRLIDYPLWTLAPWIDERAEATAEHLLALDADILCLQEVFESHHREAIVDGVKGTFPYHAENPHPPKFGVGDGLLVLSKYPLLEARFHRYRKGPWEEQLLMDRGILVAIADIPGWGPTAISNCHPTTSAAFTDPYGEEAEAHRIRQIDETMAFAMQVGRNGHRILAGDLNCSPTLTAQAFDRLLQNGWRDTVAEAPGITDPETLITFDSANNALNRACDPAKDPSGRIDHVLIRQDSGLRTTRARIVLTEEVVTVPTAERVPLSDHYGLLVDIEAA